MGDQVSERNEDSCDGGQQEQEDYDEVHDGHLWNPQHQVEYHRLSENFGGDISPHPSSSAGCQHRVSPLDPNLSSAARYSPPLYNSQVAKMEPPVKTSNSPMDAFSHISLPIINNSVSSSISSDPKSLAHPESNKAVPHCSSARISNSNTGSYVSAKRLFSKSQTLPLWNAHNMIACDNIEENLSVDLSHSVWTKIKKDVKREKISEDSQPGCSGLQAVTSGDSATLFKSNSVLHGSNERKHILQPASSCTQNDAFPDPSITLHGSQSGPKCFGTLSSVNKIHYSETNSSISDGESHDSSDSSPEFCSAVNSKRKHQLVHIEGGEAKFLTDNASICEASSTMRGHGALLSSPSTLTDNCIVSSSTGHIDSLPPTPAEFQGNDVSDPCSPVSPNLTNVRVLDSTVDSTSGQEVINSEEQSSNEAEEHFTRSMHIELPIMVKEEEEISTSVRLPQGDANQDVALLVNHQGMFSNGRTNDNHLMEHLSLSLAHYSSTSLDGRLSEIGSEHHNKNSLSPPICREPCISEALTGAEACNMSLPCTSQAVNMQNCKSLPQNRECIPISSVQKIPDSIEVLDNSLALLDIASGLPECRTGSFGISQESNKELRRNQSNTTENLSDVESYVSHSNAEKECLNNTSYIADSENQDFKELSSPYVLELQGENSTESDVTFKSCEKSSVADRKEVEICNQSPVVCNSSMMKIYTTTITTGNIPIELPLTSSSALNGPELNVALPGASQQQLLTQDLSPLNPNQNSTYNGKDVYPAHETVEAAHSQDSQVISADDQKDLSADLDKANRYLDFEHVYCADYSQHHFQTISDKPIRARAWASLPGEHLAIRKIPGKEEFGVFSKKLIPKKTRFGPLGGVMMENARSSFSSNALVYSVITRSETMYLDTSDEGSSNWMKFVRSANNYLEQNCVVMQSNSCLMFLTTVDIPPRVELKVGYAKQYASLRNLPVLEPTSQEISALEAIRKTWPCYECDENFESSAELQKHLSCHDKITKDVERKKRKRPKTQQLRTSGNEEVTMKKFVKKEKVFKREVEYSSLVEKRNLCAPASSKPYKCELCYKSFLRHDRLRAHMVVHSNEAEKPYSCSVCPRRFCSNSALSTHVKFHNEGSRVYNCPICREDFSTVVDLKGHVFTHCINNQFKCPTCNKVFLTYSKIRRHIRSYHAILPHICIICKKEMPSIEKLKIHMLSHSDRRDFLCQDCGKSFKRKDKMREHSKRMHSSERKAFLSRAAVKATPKVIPKADPTDYMQFQYKCHACLLGFKRRGMLVNHLAKRHPDVDMASVPELNQPILKATRYYYCQYCEKMYRSSSKRKLHILKYHPGKELPSSTVSQGQEIRNTEDSTYSQTVGAVTTYPHPCKLCYRQYASRARLLRHERDSHPDVGGNNSSLKEYEQDIPEPGVNNMVPLLDEGTNIPVEIPLGIGVVTDGSSLPNQQLTTLPRGELSTQEVKVLKMTYLLKLWEK